MPLELLINQDQQKKTQTLHVSKKRSHIEKEPVDQEKREENKLILLKKLMGQKRRGYEKDHSSGLRSSNK